MTQPVKPALILASSSPRRADYLRLLGVDFLSVSPDVDEAVLEDELPRDYVMRLALSKAESVRDSQASGSAVLAADTAVSLGSKIFGKPVDQTAGRDMLMQLSGRTHQVYTAVVVCRDDWVGKVCVDASVTFDALTDHQQACYWASGEGADKAGGYGIQGLAGTFVSELTGSYSAVVGLPMNETRQLLDQAGVPHRMNQLPDSDR